MSRCIVVIAVRLPWARTNQLQQFLSLLRLLYVFSNSKNLLSAQSYGYRKIRVLLNREGWNLGKYLLERFYRKEG
jgi:hypothetical protein